MLSSKMVSKGEIDIPYGNAGDNNSNSLKLEEEVTMGKSAEEPELHRARQPRVSSATISY